MFTTSGSMEHRNAIDAVAPVLIGTTPAQPTVMLRARVAAEAALDDVLGDSFPASDPPSWTASVIRPRPRHRGTTEEGTEPMAAPVPSDATGGSAWADGSRAFLEVPLSLLRGGAVALLMGGAILLVGLPIALAVRGVVDAISWVLGLVGA